MVQRKIDDYLPKKKLKNCNLENVERDVDNQHYFKQIEPCRATTKQVKN